MTIVAGVDFGTLSVRVTLVDSTSGPIGTASTSYPLHRRREDPNYATQAHADQMAALVGEAREVNDGLRALAAGIETLDLMIVRRKAFPNAAAQGRGVVEQPHRDPKAVEELNALASAAF